MRFIVVDGLDAAGKDTHAKLIKKRYEERGDDVVIRSHPSTDNLFGTKAKRALYGEGKIDRVKATVFYAMDVLNSINNHHHDHVDTVIFVRYLGGVAYLPYPLAKTLYGLFYRILPTTDYMFFLDVSPENALERIKGRKEKEMFENIDDLYKVRKRALRLVNDWHIIDTDRPLAEAHEEIKKKLYRLDNEK